MQLKALRAFSAEAESARTALQTNLARLNKQISELQKEKSELLLQLDDKTTTLSSPIVSFIVQLYIFCYCVMA